MTPSVAECYCIIYFDLFSLTLCWESNSQQHSMYVCAQAVGSHSEALVFKFRLPFLFLVQIVEDDRRKAVIFTLKLISTSLHTIPHFGVVVDLFQM